MQITIKCHHMLTIMIPIMTTMMICNYWPMVEAQPEPQPQRDETLESWRGKVDIQMMQVRVSLTSSQDKG